jgi:hypothetical protein
MGIDADAGAAGGCQLVILPGEGVNLNGIFGIDAAFDGMAANSMSRCLNQSFSPAAMRICACTMSMPVISSVTGCSTWTRVFISMK